VRQRRRARDGGERPAELRGLRSEEQHVADEKARESAKAAK